MQKGRGERTKIETIKRRPDLGVRGFRVLTLIFSGSSLQQVANSIQNSVRIGFHGVLSFRVMLMEGPSYGSTLMAGYDMGMICKAKRFHT